MLQPHTTWAPHAPQGRRVGGWVVGGPWLSLGPSSVFPATVHQLSRCRFYIVFCRAWRRFPSRTWLYGAESKYSNDFSFFLLQEEKHPGQICEYPAAFVFSLSLRVMGRESINGQVNQLAGLLAPSPNERRRAKNVTFIFRANR